MWVVVALLATVAVWAAYSRGREDGARVERLAANARAIDSVDLVLERDAAAVDSAATARVEAEDSSRVARETYRPVRDRVVVVDDSTVSIDRGPPVVLPEPLRPLAELIPATARVIHADSVTIGALRAETTLLRREVADLKEALRLRDERIAELERMTKPRLGFREGVLATLGVLGVIVLVAL